MVQCRGDGGMEEYLPLNGSQCETRLSTYGGQGVDYHSELVLAFPDRSAKVSSIDLRAARELILATPLQKIADCLEGELAGAGDYAEEDIVG